MKNSVKFAIYALSFLLVACGGAQQEELDPTNPDGQVSEKSRGKELFDSSGGFDPDTRELEGLWRSVDSQEDTMGNEVTMAMKFSPDNNRIEFGVRCRYANNRGRNRREGYSSVRSRADFDRNNRRTGSIEITQARRHIAKKDYLNRDLPEPCVASVGLGKLYYDLVNGTLIIKERASDLTGTAYYKVRD